MNQYESLAEMLEKQAGSKQGQAESKQAASMAGLLDDKQADKQALIEFKQALQEFIQVLRQPEASSKQAGLGLLLADDEQASSKQAAKQARAQKGGQVRAERLSPARRSEIARLGAVARRKKTGIGFL